MAAAPTLVTPWILWGALLMSDLILGGVGVFSSSQEALRKEFDLQVEPWRWVEKLILRDQISLFVERKNHGLLKANFATEDS